MGEVQNHYQYNAFGDTLEKVEGIPNRVQYTNQQDDTVTGQYYLRERYYIPILGRFLQEDVYQGAQVGGEEDKFKWGNFKSKPTYGRSYIYGTWCQKDTYDVQLPSDVSGRSFLPKGEEIKPNMRKVVVKSDCSIRTAYPYNSAYPTSKSKI